MRALVRDCFVSGVLLTLGTSNGDILKFHCRELERACGRIRLVKAAGDTCTFGGGSRMTTLKNSESLYINASYSKPASDLEWSTSIGYSGNKGGV
jgi:hypothetical protein